MDKYEYNVKLEQIKKLIKKKDYATAARIADTIDWYKVKNNQTIVMIADVYEASGRYEQSKENLKLAYDRSGLGRQIAYKLVKICIKCGALEEAEDFYDDFVSAAPRDISKYLLQYELAKAKGDPIDKQITILEQYLEEDMDDKWAFELAKLYHKSGQRDKCIQQCDTVMLWFSDGKYVEKAMELKMIYTSLSKSQRERYEARWREKSGQTGINAEEIQIKEVDVANKYNTQNIQNALKESMDELYSKEQKQKNKSDRVFKPVPLKEEEYQENIQPSEIYEEAEETISGADDYIYRMNESVGTNNLVGRAVSENMGAEFNSGFEQEIKDDLGDTKVFVTTRSKKNMEDTKVFAPIRQAIPEKISFDEPEDKEAYILEEKTIRNKAEEVLEKEIYEGQPKEAWAELPEETSDEVWEESQEEILEAPEEILSSEPLEETSDEIWSEQQEETSDEIWAEQQEETSDEIWAEQQEETSDEIWSEQQEETLDEIWAEQQEEVSDEIWVKPEEEPEEEATEEVLIEPEEKAEEELSEEQPEQIWTEPEEEATEEVLIEPKIEEPDIDETEELISEMEKEVALSEEYSLEDETERPISIDDFFDTGGRYIIQEEEMEEPEIEYQEPEIEDEPEEEIEEMEIGYQEPEVGDELEEEIEEMEIEYQEPEIEDEPEEEIEQLDIEYQEPKIEEPDIEYQEPKIEEPEIENEQEEATIESIYEYEELKVDIQIPEEEPEEPEDEDLEQTEYEELKKPDYEEYEEPEEDEYGDYEEYEEYEELRGSAQEETDTQYEYHYEEEYQEPDSKYSEYEEPEENASDKQETLKNEEDTKTDFTEPEEEKQTYESVDNFKIDKEFAGDNEEDQALTHEEIKAIIKDFIGKYSGVQGLDKQMLRTLQNIIVDDNCNIFIMGDAKSGKTSLGLDIIKVVNKIKRNNNRKIAKISADKLVGKALSVYFTRLMGSDIYIENISLIDDDTLRELLEVMDKDKDNRIVVIEDEKLNAERFLEKHEEISRYFLNHIVVKQNKIKDWVEVAREYAEEQGYEIDEIGLLALHAKIDELYGVTLVIQKNHVESVIDSAIKRANKGGIIKKLFGKRREKILTEEHFI